MKLIRLNNTYFNLDNIISIELAGFEGCRQVVINDAYILTVPQDEYSTIEKLLNEGVIK